MKVIERETTTLARPAVGVLLLPADAEGAPEQLRDLALSRDVRAIAWRHLEQSTSVYEAADEAARWAAAGIELLIVSGSGSRAMAVAARDAGLQLSQVVVCRDCTTACDLLVRYATPGDAILLVETSVAAREQLSTGIAARWGAALPVDQSEWNLSVAA